MILAVFSALMRKAWTRILWPAPSWPHSSAGGALRWQVRVRTPAGSNLDIFIFLTNNCCSDLSSKKWCLCLTSQRLWPNFFSMQCCSSREVQWYWIDTQIQTTCRLIKELLLFDILAASIVFNSKPKYLWVSLVLCLVIEVTALYLIRPATWVVWETVLS